MERWIDRLTRCPEPYRLWISASRLSAGTSSPSGLVVMSQKVSTLESKHLRGGLELETQDIGKSAFLGFDDGTGVMCDEPAQQRVGVLGAAQVTGAV